MRASRGSSRGDTGLVLQPAADCQRTGNVHPVLPTPPWWEEDTGEWLASQWIRKVHPC